MKKFQVEIELKNDLHESDVDGFKDFLVGEIFTVLEKFAECRYVNVEEEEVK